MPVAHCIDSIWLKMLAILAPDNRFLLFQQGKGIVNQINKASLSENVQFCVRAIRTMTSCRVRFACPFHATLKPFDNLLPVSHPNHLHQDAGLSRLPDVFPSASCQTRDPLHDHQLMRAEICAGPELNRAAAARPLCRQRERFPPFRTGSGTAPTGRAWN